ncbi:MAG: imidazoleglycerol-phosphate dehydratase HisB [Desulfomonile tiedjei]|uniref:Imidazoleglycerol-phosphate dehydratase n=1 Tax=Desulfomonile tiedjei TaxID=2358 RepID=A0A9D6V8R4_9BACT|nr:imidazoleglycerol-phosphate dehydratase HisB [Desulfomonile tiedjei]
MSPSKQNRARTAEVIRKTSETDVVVKLSLDGSGIGKIATGVGFFDHMLDHVMRHGLLDMEISANGDLHVDYHHTVEDVGLTLGEALKKAVGDKKGLRRYGFSQVPMDEALASVTLDLSGRPMLVFFNPLSDRSAGDFPLDLMPVFLQGLADRAGITMHATVLAAENPHHAAEAVFKALGRALREAVQMDPRVKGIPSTKGVL